MTAMGAFAGAVGAPPRSANEERPALSLPWLPLVPLLAIPFVGTSPERLNFVIVAMQLAFLLLAIRNPLWVLGALALSEFTIRNFNLTLPAALLIALPHLVRGADLGPKAKPMIIMAASLITLAIVADSVATNLSHALTSSRAIIAGFMVLILVPLVIKSRKDMLQIGIVVLVIATASAVVAIIQHVGGGPILTVVPNDAVAASAGVWDGRALGLSESAPRLSEHLLLFLFPLMGILLMQGLSSRTSRYVAGLILLLAIANYVTFTRSWAIGAVPATVAMAFVVRGRVGREMLLLLVIVGFGFWYWAGSTGSRYSLGFDSDGSAAARPVLWTAAYNMALDHPLLGVGFNRFQELAPQYADRIDPDVLARQYQGDPLLHTLGRFDPHNDYLNVWVSFGTGALALYSLILIHTGANFLNAARGSRDRLLKGIAVGGLAALVAFAVTYLFHSRFETSMGLWILAGVSVALVKLTRQSEATEGAEPEPNTSRHA